MGSKPAYTIVACLIVDHIRGIIPPDGFVVLDVHWELALMDDGRGNKIPNTAPGANGHSGIANLGQGGKGKQDKLKRKDLRSKLADIAEVSPVPVPHSFDEEHLRYAAYFIREKQGSHRGTARILLNRGNSAIAKSESS